MMPYDTYRLHEAGRAKSRAEARHADERAGRLAAAASRLFRAVTGPSRAAAGPIRPSPPAIASGPAEPASRSWPEPKPTSGAAAHIPA
jgi:hypothetical protein